MSELSVKIADKTELRRLGGLWKACFSGDSEEVIDNFFTTIPNDAITLVGWVGEQPATMLFLLPATAAFHDKTYAVRYLYAGCTHPKHRARGYYRQLMQAAADLVESIGEHAIYLHPADASLDKTYRRLGYQGGIIGNRRKMPKSANVVPFCMADYMRSRKQLLANIKSDVVVWDPCETVVSMFVVDAETMVIDDQNAIVTAHDSVVERIATDLVDKSVDFCLWLPVKESPLKVYMAQHGGYTGIIGD